MRDVVQHRHLEDPGQGGLGWSAKVFLLVGVLGFIPGLIPGYDMLTVAGSPTGTDHRRG